MQFAYSSILPCTHSLIQYTCSNQSYLGLRVKKYSYKRGLIFFNPGPNLHNVYGTPTMRFTKLTYAAYLSRQISLVYCHLFVFAKPEWRCFISISLKKMQQTLTIGAYRRNTHWNCVVYKSRLFSWEICKNVFTVRYSNGIATLFLHFLKCCPYCQKCHR